MNKKSLIRIVVWERLLSFSQYYESIDNHFNLHDKLSANQVVVLFCIATFINNKFEKIEQTFEYIFSIFQCNLSCIFL